MTAPQLPGIYQRLERAQLNFKHLSEELASHDGVALVADLNEGVFRAKVAGPLPGWPLLVSDIVCDTRYVLDNLAYQLAIANAGSNPPPSASKIEFPVFVSQQNFMKGGLAKIADLDPGVQRLIERLQPYNEPVPKDYGLFIINEMCNTYKHRHLLPIPHVMVKSFNVRMHAIGCTVSNLIQVQPNLRELEDGEIVATFDVEIHSDDATISAGTQPFPFLGFPTDVPGETLNILDMCLLGLHTVRAIIAALTEIQWGASMDLPETEPYFVAPLAMVIPKPYL